MFVNVGNVILIKFIKIKRSMAIVKIGNSDFWCQGLIYKVKYQWNHIFIQYKYVCGYGTTFNLLYRQSRCGSPKWLWHISLSSLYRQWNSST